ncbi:hypothetical protein H109_06803 [Trichophyton interdigitale MR816]|uniref:Heterokaryon incompatibility domain-containing protein n=1 Tax=Trichophyton interdigitale (strain MR816) TaxID=1215338 RepID=A0A059J0I8_TRIIM|nr:hypothetical protein H101_02341 [Trichophyton interdigitale H6]KDB21279.1 hypothetical protein H109_06803 [Trichophyton interdigitale MR816]
MDKMHHWHEAGCQQPAVVILDDSVRCNSCLSRWSHKEAVEVTSTLTVPHIESLSHLNLSWPESVKYTHSNITYDDMSTPSLLSKPLHDPQLVPSVANTNSLDNHPDAPREYIRLLALHPGQGDDPIRGDIMELSFKDLDAPPYQTLSYSPFDDPTSISEDSSDEMLSEQKPQPRNCPVYLDHDWDVIYVTKNCEAGLKAIRHLSVGLPVWVDLISIDQDNNDHRSRWVALIKCVFANAVQSMIFVGAPSGDSDYALDLLASIYIRGAPSVLSRVAATKEESKSALKSLFKRPCFSGLWLVQQFIYAKRPWILCGDRSLPWPPWSFMPNGMRRCASLLLFNREAWIRLIDKNFYNILRHALTHECLDPRDKIYAILGLLGETGISIDYSLPVEVVYTGITAYLLQNHLSFRLFDLLGADEQRLNLPSWVPDYSQRLQVDNSFDIATWVNDTDDQIEIGESKTVRILYPFEFHNPEELPVGLDREVEIGSDGSLSIFAVKLCDISPMDSVTKSPQNSQHFIVIDKGRHGYILISLKKKEYKIGDDSIFLLNGSLYPVIMRRDPRKGTYSFLSFVSMALVYPNDDNVTWRFPCGQEHGMIWPFDVPLRVSQTTTQKIQEFYSSLLELCEVDPTQTPVAPDVDLVNAERKAVVDFGILRLTGFNTLEAKLKSTWQSYREKFGWMLRDQAAIWKFIRYIEQEDQKDWSGVGSMVVEERVGLLDNYATDIKTEYSWNLRQFFWSFLKSTAVAPDILDVVWNPAYEALKAHTSDFQSWAEVTEKLMNSIAFSRTALGSSMGFFPGINIPEKWSSSWKCFSVAREGGIYHDGEVFGSECYWNWSEFERCLDLRDTLLAQVLPEELRPRENHEMQAHMSFRVWGLNLDQRERVSIV